jgi:hypothetical protein
VKILRWSWLIAASALLAPVLALALPGSAAVAQQAPPPGATYVVGTYDGSVLRLFVNGKVVARRQFTGQPGSSGSSVQIGSFLGGQSWYGTLDEVALYKRALGGDTIGRHYALGIGQGNGRYVTAVRATPGLVAYWHLNDQSTSRAAEALGRHPGRYTGGAKLRVPGLIARDTNRAVAFNGGAASIVVPRARDLSLTRSFTLEAWASAGTRRAQTIIAKPDSWFLKTDLFGHWGVGFADGQTLNSVFSKTTAVPATPPVSFAGNAAPPPSSSTTPAATTTASKGSSKSNNGLLTIAIVVAVGIAAWLVVVAHRRSGDDDEEKEESDDREGDDRQVNETPTPEAGPLPAEAAAQETDQGGEGAPLESK